MKRTFQRKKKKRLRKHGFLFRQFNSSFIISRRRSKGRWQLAATNTRRKAS